MNKITKQNLEGLLRESPSRRLVVTENGAFVEEFDGFRYATVAHLPLSI